MHNYTIVAGILTAFLLLTLHACDSSAEQPSGEEEVYMFSYFMGNGESGLHLAYSEDGMTWKALNEGESFLEPEIGTGLMRDPSIVQGPDGMFHMVWTTGWWDQGIGIAHSEDLVHWSEQTFLPVMEHEPDAENSWAPEIYYDEATETYLICWATTIPGRFPETEHPEDDHNHRMYYVTTRDFQTYTETELFYEPGFNVIDTFIIFDEENDRYAMFLKDERLSPVTQKNIRVAFADQAAGPYGEPSEPIHDDYWAEGPTALQIDGRWIVYFDRYREGRFGASASDDLETWTDISDEISFPDGARHGTTFTVSRKVLEAVKNGIAP